MPQSLPPSGEKVEEGVVGVAAPLLLRHLLSPSTAKYDRGTKLMLYRQLDNLQDVLLIDPASRLVEHRHRGIRGWKGTTRKRGAIAVLGGVIQVGELFEGLEA